MLSSSRSFSRLGIQTKKTLFCKTFLHRQGRAANRERTRYFSLNFAHPELKGFGEISGCATTSSGPKLPVTGPMADDYVVSGETGGSVKPSPGSKAAALAGASMCVTVCFCFPEPMIGVRTAGDNSAGTSPAADEYGLISSRPFHRYSFTSS